MIASNIVTILLGLYVLVAIYAVFSLFYSGRRDRGRFALVVMALISASMVILEVWP
jgi:hypothetical protein